MVFTCSRSCCSSTVLCIFLLFAAFRLCCCFGGPCTCEFESLVFYLSLLCRSLFVCVFVRARSLLGTIARIVNVKCTCSLDMCFGVRVLPCLSSCALCVSLVCLPLSRARSCVFTTIVGVNSYLGAHCEFVEFDFFSLAHADIILYQSFCTHFRFF